ncbi:helix-turn-helix domain-containing protein [Cohnella sp. GCM10012308]|uniref:helix-turn-helix domain-containing protein n=1 Tax=Cohnella sp. GCM10012308 TaxID=3317329 RepID=UPI00360F1D3F
MFNFESKEALAEWIAHEVVSTAEAAELLNCSRQNLHAFVTSGKLTPIKETNRERLFWRSDVLARKEEASKYKKKAST